MVKVANNDMTNLLNEYYGQTRKWLDQTYRLGLNMFPNMSETRKVRQAIFSKLRHNPVLLRYLDHNTLPRVLNRNTAAWHALGEKLGVAITAAAFDIEPIPLQLEDTKGIYGKPTDTGSEWVERFSVSIALKALIAQPYLWREDIRSMASKMPIPRHTITPDLLPLPIMFWSYEAALPVRLIAGATTDTTLINADIETNYFLVEAVQDGIVWWHDLNTPLATGPGWLARGGLRYGETYPDDVPEAFRLAASQILAQIAFLNSPYVDKASERIPRSIRRELTRIPGPPFPDDSISVIKLRRQLSDAINKSDESGSGREYKHQWWVSGHIRAQWYPSIKAHKLIWVAPYVKGPADKPLKDSVRLVVR